MDATSPSKAARLLLHAAKIRSTLWSSRVPPNNLKVILCRIFRIPFFLSVLRVSFEARRNHTYAASLPLDTASLPLDASHNLDTASFPLEATSRRIWMLQVYKFSNLDSASLRIRTLCDSHCTASLLLNAVKFPLDADSLSGDAASPPLSVRSLLLVAYILPLGSCSLSLDTASLFLHWSNFPSTR